MTLNFLSSCCLHFPHAGTSGVPCRTQLHSRSVIVRFTDSPSVPGSLFNAILFFSSQLNLLEASPKTFFLFPHFFLIIKSFFSSILYCPHRGGGTLFALHFLLFNLLSYFFFYLKPCANGFASLDLNLESLQSFPSLFILLAVPSYLLLSQSFWALLKH